MKRRLLLLLIACLFGAGQSAGQELDLPVQHLGVGEGLPQGSIYSLLQDAKGFIWIGTGDGLARWDGHSFRTFRGRHGDTSGRVLPARIVRGQMLEDGAGGLWMGSSLGLVRYDQQLEHFRIIPLGMSFDVERDAILGLDGGRLWLRIGQAVYHTDLPAGNHAERLNIRLQPSAMTAMSGSRLFISDSSGLSEFSLRDGVQRRLIAQKGILQLLPAAAGIQLFTNRELLFWNGKSITRYTLPLSMRAKFTGRIAAGPVSGYGVGADGLLRYDLAAGSVETFATHTDPTRSLSNVLVNVIMADRSGNLWVGTEGTGLDVIDTKGFKFNGWPPRAPDGRPQELMVKSLCDVGGKLWIGTFDDGIYVLDRPAGAARHIIPPGKGLRRTSLLFRDSDGRVWMNRDGRIGIADTATKDFRLAADFPGVRNDNLTAYSMAELAKGDYLAGTTFSLHRIRLKEGRIHIQELAPGHPATTGIIAALEVLRDGSIFIGKVRDGFYRIRLNTDGGGIEVLDEGLHYTGIRDFQAAPDGLHIWMATENGLVYYNPETKSLRLLDEADGLSNSHIYGIVPDGDTALWLSTNKGLNRLSFSRSRSGALTQVHVRSYGAQDGLQSNEFNTGAFCRMADGAIVFGGVAGVNWFYPGAFRANPHRPQVALTGISVNERPLRSDTAYAYLQTLSLPYTQNTLAFQMAALEFTNAAANRYAYKLEGFDKDWVDGGAQGVARYANLPPGEYRFLAKAANGDGVWSGQPATLCIVIHPPWWGTLAARVVGVLLLICLLALGIRLYIRRRVAAQLREMEKQQAVNEERLRISRDMHDELGTGLTKIALLSQVAQRKAAGTQPASFMEINSTSRQLTQKIGEIVWTLNPQNDTLDTLAAYIREWVQEQYDALEGVAVKTDFEERLPAIPLGHSKRQALLLVTKEAVNNAVKYSGAREIVVQMRLDGNAILFEVRDYGCGFKEGERSKGGSGNGLKNMAARMAAADGHFSIKSTVGKGTAVRYSIPR